MATPPRARAPPAPPAAAAKPAGAAEAGAGSPPAKPEQARDFSAFPHPPYPIQTAFMQRLYTALEAGGLALFESPTGTGKTLSLIVGALTWLEDKRAAAEAAAAADARASVATALAADLPPWLAAAAAERDAEAAAAAAARRAARLDKARARRDAALDGGGAPPPKKPGAAGSARRQPPPPPAPSGDDLVIEDRDDEEGEPSTKRPPPSPPSSDASSSDSDTGRGVVDRPGAAGIRVIVTSRTHSQLAQFMAEFGRTRFADSFAAVALASRAALCVNDAVLAHGSSSRISEACLDLQTARGRREAAKTAKREGADAAATRAAARAGCPFRAPPGGVRRRLRDALLATPHDVEDAAAAGQAAGCCPYYAARAAAADADLIFLPYSALLAADARDALGVALDNAVVIVDEAHNLPAAVSGAASATLTRRGAEIADAALAHYLATYGARLGPATRRDVQTLLAMCRGVVKAAGWGGDEEAAAPPKPRALTLDAFSAASGLDNVNAFRLVQSLRDRKAIPKVAGAAAAAAAAAVARGGAAVTPHPRRGGGDGDATPPDPTPSAALHALTSFILSLTTADADGRVVASPAALRFVLLNAGARFGAVLARARAVVLASGTLEPTRSLEAQLFPPRAGGAVAAAHRFACGHVLPRERLLALAVGVGPTGVAFDLRAGGGTASTGRGARDAPATLDELGRLLTNVCAVVPGGVVAFFPSFAALAAARARWGVTGAAAALAARKRVFCEPRAAAAAAAVLAAFSAAAVDGAGALMLCVVGAKLSEGINFGDALGRCALVVGVPYPPPDDAELVERAAFLDAAVGRGAGRALYEDTAAVAVNQAVGRAVRHANDWAAVVLVDVRYTQPNGPATRLPAWMRPSFRVAGGYGDAHAALAAFCRRMVKEG